MYSAKGHLPIIFIVDHVGCDCSLIRVAHLHRRLVALDEASLSDFQSITGWFYLLRVPNLCHFAIIWGPKIYSSILYLMLVEVFFPYVEVIFLRLCL